MTIITFNYFAAVFKQTLLKSMIKKCKSGQKTKQRYLLYKKASSCLPFWTQLTAAFCIIQMEGSTIWLFKNFLLPFRFSKMYRDEIGILAEIPEKFLTKHFWPGLPQVLQIWICRFFGPDRSGCFKQYIHNNLQKIWL